MHVVGVHKATFYGQILIHASVIRSFHTREDVLWYRLSRTICPDHRRNVGHSQSDISQSKNENEYRVIVHDPLAHPLTQHAQTTRPNRQRSGNVPWSQRPLGYKKVFSPRSSLPPLHLHPSTWSSSIFLTSPRLEPIYSSIPSGSIFLSQFIPPMSGTYLRRLEGGLDIFHLFFPALLGPYEHDRCPIRLALNFPCSLPPLSAWLKEVKVNHRKSDVGELNVTVTFVAAAERGSASARTTSWRSERKPHTVIGNAHVTSRHRNSAQGYKKVFSPHSFLPSLHLHLCYSRLEPINPFNNTSSISFVFGLLCYY